jgi:CBS domain-containing protein
MEDDLSQLEQEEIVVVPPDAAALEDGRLVGIFTEHDVLSKLTGARAQPTTVAVKELMSPNPEALRETDSVAVALNKMSIGRYRHIPIQKTDGAYSVVSIKNVLKYIAKEDW